MRITLITGFLGAGKTTLLKRLLREISPEKSIGVIINDLSELDVDGELVGLSQRVSEKEGTLISLSSGSISDKRRLEFIEALEVMEKQNLEHLIIETSGGSLPDTIIEELQSRPACTLHTVLVMVDARALYCDYACGEALLKRTTNGEIPSGLFSTEHLLLAQLRSASVIALSKIDLIPELELPALLRALQKINPTAQLTACVFGKIDSKVFFDSAPYVSVKKLPSQVLTTIEDYDMGTTVLREPRPLHPERFYRHYSQNLGLGIFRSKGFIWMASRPDQVLLWNQAGGAMGLELLALWRIAILKEGKLLPEELAELKKQLAHSHPLFGDRNNELTVIGQARDRRIFCEGLQSCFCTDSEVEHWQRGGSFKDPWPKNLKTIF